MPFVLGALLSLWFSLDSDQYMAVENLKRPFEEISEILKELNLNPKNLTESGFKHVLLALARSRIKAEENFDQARKNLSIDRDFLNDSLGQDLTETREKLLNGIGRAKEFGFIFFWADLLEEAQKEAETKFVEPDSN